MTIANQMPLVEVQREGPVARVILGRPEHHNALSANMTSQLVQTFEALGSDDTVHCIVLTGRGPSFCSGRDVAELREALVEGASLPLTPIPAGRMSLLVRSLPQVVVASVQGAALGEGFDLALACDFTIVASDAVLGDPHLQHGVVPGAGVWTLPRLVGSKRAAQVLYLGRRLSGAEAAEWGLVTEAVELTELAEATDGVVAALVALNPLSLRGTKQAIRTGSELPMAEVLDAVALTRTISAQRGRLE